MNIPRFLCLLVLLMWGSACQQTESSDEPEATHPPNIVLIMTDDQGWGDLSLHGNDSIDTPVLDQLGQQSIRFDRFYVSPVCAPTRASLLTGRYHLRTGTSFVTGRREVMRSEETTLAEVLKDAGYATGLFGKWHNGEQYPNDPNGQGFDTFFGFCAGHWNNYFNTTLQHNQDMVQTEGYISDVLTDQAIAFIQEQQAEPFFCYIPYNAPHGPFQVPDRYFDKYKARGLTDKNASVYGMCENIDDNVGRVLQTLDSLQLRNNTVVIFLTDNGPNGQRYNGGMRGTKASVHEGGVRVPFFISWPGGLTGNREISQLAAHIDVLPTLAELTGTPLPDDLKLDGRSLVPLLRNEASDWSERAIFTTHMSRDTVLTRGAYRDATHRLVIEPAGVSLFNMQVDPGQENDLASSQAKLTDSLYQLYADWFAEATIQGFAVPPIPVGYPAAPLVHLPAPEAYRVGNPEFHGGAGWANDWVTNWKATGDQVGWPIQIEAEGPYAVALWYSGNEAILGANFTVTAGATTIPVSVAAAHDPPYLPSPDRINRGEVYEKVWKKLDVGTFELKPGRDSLVVQLVDLPSGANFSLKAAEIKRIPVD